MSQLSRWGLKNYLYLFTLSGLNWRELLKKLVHFIFVYNKYFWLVDPYRKSLYTYGGLSTLCHSCGFASQQRVLKTFPGPGYLHSENGVVWLWHSLVNLYIWLIISACCGSIPLTLGLIGRDGGLIEYSCVIVVGLLVSRGCWKRFLALPILTP